MAAGFRTRRIKTEQSIGDKLKRSRIRKKITVAEVEEATKIRAKFILALESDSWEQIPSEVYGRGYLERYVQFLQMEEDAVMKQYDRERAMYARTCQDSHVELAPKNRLTIPRFLLTPRFFVIGTVTTFTLALLGFISFQVMGYVSHPLLQLVPPVHAAASQSGIFTAQNDTINLTGHTAPNALVTVNGTPVQVDADNNFSVSEHLQKGINNFVVTSTLPSGNMTSDTQTIILPGSQS